MKNKGTVAGGILLIVIACGILLYQFVITKYINVKEENRTVKTSEGNEEQRKDEVKEAPPMIEEGAEVIEPDLPENYYMNENFVIKEIPSSVTLEEEKKLAEAIQTYMYLWGYAGFDHATFKGMQELEYLNQILVTVDIGVEDEFRLQAIFNKDNRQWKIVTW